MRRFQVQTMSNEVCSVVFFILLLSTPAQPRDCNRALDVVIVLDSGRDIPDTDWTFMTHLSRDLAYHLRPSTSGSHIALLQFSGNTSVISGLDTEVVIRDRSVFTTGKNLSNAFETTRRLVLNNRDEDRPEVPDVIVLITNGLANDRQSAVTEATRVKSEGIKIVTIGVTNSQVDELREELRELATDADNVDSLMLINHKHYPSVLSVLVQTVCKNRIEAVNESLRLVDGTSNTGKLELYINEEWVTICSTGWTNINTQIACKQLGFPYGQSMYMMNQTSYHRRVGIANIKCVGYETSLVQCLHDPLFHTDSSCDHRRDVYLKCLCGNCNDYVARDNVRLGDRNSISGRLEVFSPGMGWGGVCSSRWTTSNTQVACRQLGFLGEAGTYRRGRIHSITLVLFRVSCFGNEGSLFDCKYTTISSESCRDPIYIRCECTDCHDLLLQSPQQKEAVTQSTGIFEWRLNHNISDFEISFLPQKNPETLLYVEDGLVVKKNTRFKHRIKLINDDHATVGFNLSKITTADMGIYSLYVPKLLLESKAILIVTDFAIVPDAVIYRQINDEIVISWDMTALRQLWHMTHEIFLTTPATGRLHLDTYYTQWIRENPGRHAGVPQPIDDLHPTVTISSATMKDAGLYIVEVTLTSFVYQWLNFSWQNASELIIAGNDDSWPTGTTTIVLGVLLGTAILAIIVLLCVCRKRGTKIRRLKTTTNSRTLIAPPAARAPRRLPIRRETGVDEGYTPTEEYLDDNHDYDERDSVNIDITDEEEYPPLPPRDYSA